MILCKADITSKNEMKVETFKANYELVRQKMVEVEEKDRIRNFKNPITGEIVMQRYNIPPSNVIGQIKEVIKNAILDGEIPNDFDAAYALMEKVAAELGLK
jgi:poly(A) polymerase